MQETRIKLEEVKNRIWELVVVFQRRNTRWDAGWYGYEILEPEDFGVAGQSYELLQDGHHAESPGTVPDVAQDRRPCIYNTVAIKFS